MTDPSAGPLPRFVAPMLAAAGPLPDGAWALEYKLDGVRAIAYTAGGQHRVLSRNGNDVTGSHPELGELGARLQGRPAVLDGEIVALEPDGRPSFARLQSRVHVVAPRPALLRAAPVVFVAFDVLHLDGRSTVALSYEHRRELLTDLGLDGETIRTAQAFTGLDAEHVLRAAAAAGHEGLVAKRLRAPYRPGRRSTDWTKHVLRRTQEVVVVGYTPGAGRRTGAIGALLLATVDASGLRFVGQVGTGFTAATLTNLRTALAPLRRRTPPLPDVPREHARHATWVEPALVGEVTFRAWTPGGRLRHPAWRGLLADREPAAALRRPEPPQVAVDGVMQTPDGRWQVQAVRAGASRWYRLRHDVNVVDGLDLAGVERLLRAAGIALQQLREPDGDAA